MKFMRIKKIFDCILGNQFSVENYKLSKIIKNYFLDFLLNPSLFLIKKKEILNFILIYFMEKVI